MSFLQDVHEFAEKRTSKADFIEYFRQEYGVTWKEEAAAHLSGTRDKKSRAWKSAMRNFQDRKTQKASDPTKPTKKWKEEGAKFPDKAPSGGVHITGTVRFKISNYCVERDVDEIFPVDEAQILVNMTSESDMIQAVINMYMTGDVEMDSQGQASSECGESEFHIEAIEV